MADSVVGRRNPGLVFVFLLIALPAAVYSNSLGGTWLLDDASYILRNPELERVWPPWRHFLDSSTVAVVPRHAGYRPVQPLSLSMDFWVADRLDADRRTTLHVGNVVIHLLSTFLLFLLCRRLLSLPGAAPVPASLRDPAAFFAALLWAVHPVAGIPVNYLSGRSLLLMQLFSLATMLVYVRMRSRGGVSLRGAFGSLLLFGLAFCSKETAIGLVPLAVCFELLLAPGRREGDSRHGAFAIVMGLPVVAVLWQHRWFLDLLSIDYGLVQLSNHLWHYAFNAIWPFQARLLPYIEARESLLDPAVLTGLGFVLLSLALAWRWRSSRPLAALCILAYWALFSPTSSLIALYELANDYRQVPSLAPLCLLGVVVLFTTLRPRLAIGVATAAALYLAGASYAMNGLYRDGKTYWTHVVGHGGTPLAMLYLARAIEDDEPERSEALLLEALAIEPENPFVHMNLGMLRVRFGRTEEGLPLLEKAVELRPRRAGARHLLAKVYDREGRLEDARRESVRAAELAPRNMEHALGAGRQLVKVGEFEAALPYLARVADYSPLHPQAVFQEGLALLGLERLGEAEERFRRYVEWKPRDALAQYQLGEVLMAQGRLPEAIEAFERVIELQRGPIEQRARESLAVARARLSDPGRD